MKNLTIDYKWVYLDFYRRYSDISIQIPNKNFRVTKEHVTVHCYTVTPQIDRGECEIARNAV